MQARFWTKERFPHGRFFHFASVPLFADDDDPFRNSTLFLPLLAADSPCCRVQLFPLFWCEDFVFSSWPVNLNQSLAPRAREIPGLALDVLPANALKAINRILLHAATEQEGCLRSPSPFLLFSIKNRDRFNDDFRNWPLHLHRSVFGLDRALILAINELAFDEDVSTRLDLCCVIGCRSVRNALMPAGLLLEIPFGIFVAFRRGDGEFGHVPPVLGGAGAGILAGEACEGYSIDIH